ncbi:hypothetical protein HMPREF1317_0231 [Schaalia georgiae F0490]|uniref:HXXEE domain-containing protein n=1 Tax=Schaalia georgiae F0490 TaxID=1125717 RepID=J0WZJ7_9ACTO|nr:HXXEE domain-containing protein [Schaalia georgiae]EJF41746.1 hypothetical protein HMPREF1317_0231 [Schaalia georgiae F0490]
MNANDRAWALTTALIGVHQGEELLLPVADWLDRVGSSGWAGLDAHVRSSPLAGRDPWARAGTVAVQGAALCALYLATRRSARATRAATSALTLGWAAAFCMHIAVSARTRSFMPGTATSVVPGLPGALLVLRRIRATRSR